MGIAADDPDGAGRVILSNSLCSGIRRHSTADDEIGIVGHNVLFFQIKKFPLVVTETPGITQWTSGLRRLLHNFKVDGNVHDVPSYKSTHFEGPIPFYTVIKTVDGEGCFPCGSNIVSHFDCSVIDSVKRYLLRDIADGEVTRDFVQIISDFLDGCALEGYLRKFLCIEEIIGSEVIVPCFDSRVDAFHFYGGFYDSIGKIFFRGC